MNRRDLIRQGSIAAVAGALWAGLSARSWAALPPVPGWDEADERLLTLAGDTILPATPGSPGAGEVGIGRFILAMTAACHGSAEAAALRQVLADIEGASRARGARNFAALPSKEREAVLLDLEARAGGAAPGKANGFRHLKQLTLLGYFTSEAGATQALRYDPVPGTYRGSVPLAPGDRSWAL